MTLGFKKIFPDDLDIIGGKPTFFVEEILAGFEKESVLKFYRKTYNVDFNNPEELLPFLKQVADYTFDLNVFNAYRAAGVAKRHTIRIDAKDLWKAGNDIHFVINNRQQNRFQFAPTIKCISTQEIKVSWFNQSRYLEASKLYPRFYNHVQVNIDGSNQIIKEINELSLNDGFSFTEQFFAYFNESFSGKIIHWTPLKY